MAEITITFAFIAGLISFLSPCILPLVPAFLTFLAGTSIKELQKNPLQAKAKIILNTIAFVLGFSLIFSIVGVLLQSVLSTIAYDLRIYLNYVGGIMIILFGLMLTGLVKVPFLETEHKLEVKKTGITYLTSFLFGAAFAAGWTPCIGAVLGGILTVAITNPTAAFPLMLTYSIGLALPFLLTGIFISQASGIILKLSPYLKILNIIFGAILVLLGILVFTNQLALIANLGFINDLLLTE